MLSFLTHQEWASQSHLLRSLMILFRQLLTDRGWSRATINKPSVSLFIQQVSNQLFNFDILFVFVFIILIFLSLFIRSASSTPHLKIYNLNFLLGISDFVAVLKPVTRYRIHHKRDRDCTHMIMIIIIIIIIINYHNHWLLVIELSFV